MRHRLEEDDFLSPGFFVDEILLAKVGTNMDHAFEAHTMGLEAMPHALVLPLLPIVLAPTPRINEGAKPGLDRG